MRTGYKVGDVMTQKPIVAPSDADIQSLAKTMAEYKINAVIVAEGKSLKGIVTEQDIIRKAIALGKNPLELKANDVMEKNLTTINPNIDLKEALVLMSDLNIRHLPVIEDKSFVGLLTMKDILKIQPHLLELISHKINLREEERKIINLSPKEGICNICGEYSEELIKEDGFVVCKKCTY
jgi:CBS domain-containing protein